MDPREVELNALVARAKGEQSELRLIELFPEAKRLYEELHPETKQGGDRTRQIPKKGSWCAFHVWAAGQMGLSTSTVYRRLDQAAALSNLDRDARDAMEGTILANRIGIAVRIAAIPESRTQLVLVEVFISAGMRKGKAELDKAEKAFGTAKEKRTEKEKEPAPEPSSDDGSSSQPQPGEGGQSEEGDHPHDGGGGSPEAGALPAILAALGANDAVECAAVVDQLRVEAAGVANLRGEVEALKRTNKALEAEIAMYQAAPIGRLYRLLGAKSASDALAKVKALMENRDAAA